MKRLGLLIAFVLAGTAAFADPIDRDVLVTPRGAVYSVESVSSTDSTSAAQSMIEFTIQTEAPQSAQASALTAPGYVPDSLQPGYHTFPSLAYDAETDTLFVLWLHMPNMMSSELLLSSYKDGVWSKAVSIDNSPWKLRYNVRVAITRRVSTLQPDGTYADAPTLLLHVTWWEDSGSGQSARYALVPIGKGQIGTTEIHSLIEFADTAAAPAPAKNAPTAAAVELLRHPAFLDNGTADSVDVLFGDATTSSLRRVTVKPIADTRIRIPVGRSGGGYIELPDSVGGDWTGRITAVNSPRNDSVVLVKTDNKALTYLTYSGGAWSSMKSIVTNAKISTESAMNALARMITSE